MDCSVDDVLDPSLGRGERLAAGLGCSVGNAFPSSGGTFAGFLASALGAGLVSGKAETNSVTRKYEFN